MSQTWSLTGHLHMCGKLSPIQFFNDQLNYDGHTNSFKIMKPITPQNKWPSWALYLFDLNNN